ncbi:MAG: glycerol-3-phosphate acyltransferase [Chloroflexota bacterium]
MIVVGLCLLGYIFGSFPFALWITKIVKQVDVRDAGSKHATTTNTIRQAGWIAGGFVFILDIAKGFFPTYLALKYSPIPWIIPFVAGLAVAGHCWPIFAQFKGGMGLATASGAILAIYPFGFLIEAILVISLTLVLKHGARAAVITGILLGPSFYLGGQQGIIVWLGIATGLVIIIRFLEDWNRQYNELWLDREN